MMPQTPDSELLDTLAAQRAENIRLTDALDLARAELEGFKADVHRVASSYSVRHGWCDTVSDALNELGLSGVTKDYDVMVYVEGAVTVTVDAASEGAAMNAAQARFGLGVGDVRELRADDGYADLEITDVRYSAEESD